MPAELIPLHDWVLIEPEEYKTGGGILIPEGVDVDPETMSKTGRVLAVGNGPLMDSAVNGFGPMECRPGERVEYLTPRMRPIKVQGKVRHVVRDRDVIFRYGDS